MSGGTRRTTRTRTRTRPAESTAEPEPIRRPIRSRDHGPIRILNVRIRNLLELGIGFMCVLFVVFFVFYSDGKSEEQSAEIQRLKRFVTPLPAPKMMDLPQFQGEHKESLYWGTYRPQVYLGIRARTPKSLIAGLMWIGMKDGQYYMRHVCQDSDDLASYGWTDHNGRDYGRQVIIDHGLSLTTSFFKKKESGGGYGGDWSVRLNVENAKSKLEEAKWTESHMFFYIADEEGNSIDVGPKENEFRDVALLASGVREDVGGWQLYLKSPDKLEMHFAGFRTPHMHNLTDLVQGTLAVNGRRTGQLLLPDAYEETPNIMVFQISAKVPSTVDIAFVSGTEMMSSGAKERINSLTGEMLSSSLSGKQKDFEEKYVSVFNMKDKVDSEEMVVGRAAIGNMLGGIGYFFGQSKIALPKGFVQKDGEKFLSYWPAALYTAVPSRSFFPRGFLWDEGFHQLIIWRWDINICMDIIGHWLDLINIDGWIPREQILGAEALSKVPEEFVPQHPSNGNPPTLFLALRELVKNAKESKFSGKESEDIFAFLDRANVRLGAWFKWFNTSQSGKEMSSFYWHGRDKTATRELNPKALSSGLDDYPRASHPSDDERHVDLRCWMLLAADSMSSIAKLLSLENALEKDYSAMAEKLSNFELLNKMHLDVSGAYFDYGNHTEKVRLKWHEVRNGDIVQRQLLRETLESPQLTLVPHVGYVSLFPFMMGIIPPESWVLDKQLDLISNHSTLWTDYGIRSLSKTSSMYMKRNTEHDAPYWRGPIWINMNYMILSALHHYSQTDGPYRDRAGKLYEELRSNLIRNIVKNYYETGYLWENYDQKNRGKGKGARPFTGWTSLVLLIMAEAYPIL